MNLLENLGFVYRKLGDFKRARQVLNEAVELGQKNST